MTSKKMIAPRRKQKPFVGRTIPHPKRPNPMYQKDYIPFPSPAARKSIGYSDVAKYSQHRMQDIGRAIALGTANNYAFIGRNKNTWTFNRRFRNKTETHQVTWNGLGVPVAGLSDTTYSQGTTYVADGVTKHLAGQPDQYTWAAWFIVNGAPSDEKWPPLPSRNHEWNMYPEWIEYPYP